MSWRGYEYGQGFEYLSEKVSDAAKTLAQFDEEDKSKLEKRLHDNLKKASSAAGPMEVRTQYLRNMSWQKLTTDYVEKFYETFWNTLGDRPWVDHHDFHVIIAQGIKFYCPPPGIDDVPDEDFHHHINVSVATAFDKGRYYYWSREVIKKNMTDKRNFKEVRNAIDNARDQVVAVCPDNISGFLSAWVGQSVAELAKESAQNPKAHIRVHDFVKLFVAMCVEGKGLPFLLTQIYGVPDDLEKQISNLLTLAYAPFPEVRNMAGSSRGGAQQPQGQQAAIADMTSWFGTAGIQAFGGIPGIPGLPPGLVGGIPGIPGLPGGVGRSSPY